MCVVRVQYVCDTCAIHVRYMCGRWKLCGQRHVYHIRYTWHERYGKELTINRALEQYSTLNRGIKGTEKLKGPFKQNCTYLDHDVQPPHTSITIDVHHRKIFI